MKKLTILLLFLLSNLAFAQSIVNQNGSGIKYYSYGEQDNSQVVISPAPGIFIQTPWLTKDIAREVNDSMKNDPEEDIPKIKKNEPKITSKPAETIPDVLPNVVNNEKSKSFENNDIKSTQKEISTKAQGQAMINKKNIITNDISVWNRTSQDIIEKKANDKLAKDYQDFLMN